MSQWEDETYRLEQEVAEAIKNAGGTPDAFGISVIARFLFACQCNSIEIFRLQPDGEQGKLHVAYNPDLKKEGNRI